MIWMELCTTYSSSCCHHFHHPLLQWTPANPGSPGKRPLKWREGERERERQRGPGCSATTNLAWMHGGWFHSAIAVASLQILRTKIAACDNHYRGLGDIRLLISGVWLAFLVECQIFHHSHLFLSVCTQPATGIPLIGTLFLAAYSIMYRYLILLLSSLSRNSVGSLYEKCVALNCSKICFCQCIY